MKLVETRLVFSVCNKQRFYPFHTTLTGFAIFNVFLRALKQNYPSLYKVCLDGNYCVDGTCVPPTNRNNTPFVTLLVKIQPFELFGFMFYKMSSNRETAISLTSHTARGVLVKPKNSPKTKWVFRD
jgi:hypothetical protein